MEAKELVLDFFARHARKSMPVGEKELLGCHYLDVGIIDSLGIVEMINEFEDTLGITFTAQDMQSYEFQTIGGLIDTVNRLLAEMK